MKNADKSAAPRTILVVHDGEMNNDDLKRLTEISGLTKREYFAGLAMQGILSGSALDKEMTTIQMEYYAKNYPEKTHNQCISILAVELADELLKQLENG